MKTIMRFLLCIMICLGYNSCGSHCDETKEVIPLSEEQPLQTKTYYAAVIYKIFSVFQERGGKLVLKIDWVKPSPYPTHIQLQYYKNGYWVSMIDCIGSDGVFGDALSFPPGNVRFRIRGIENVYNAGDDDNSPNVTPWSYEYTFSNTLENVTLADNEIILRMIFSYAMYVSDPIPLSFSANVYIDGSRKTTVGGGLSKDNGSKEVVTFVSGALSGAHLSVEVTYGSSSKKTNFSTSIYSKLITAYLDPR